MASIETPGSPAISPDGKAVAFTIRTADWQKNRYDREIHIIENGKTVQLTNNPKGSSGDIAWSPDGKRISYRASTDIGTQIFIMNRDGSNVRQITALPGGINSYIWSPDGRYMALKLSERPAKSKAQVENAYGNFAFADDYSGRDHLWLLDLTKAQNANAPIAERSEHTDTEAPLRRLTGGTAFTIGSFFGGGFTFTPDSKEILFDHAKSGSPYDLGTQDISAVNIATAKQRPVVRRPGMDLDPKVSPDGKTVAFHMGEPPYYYTRQYWMGLTPIEGGKIERISNRTDKYNDANIIGWQGNAIFFMSHYRVESDLFRMDLDSRNVTNLTTGRGRVEGYSFSADGKTVAFGAVDGERATEIYTRKVTATGYADEKRLTQFSQAIADWPKTEVRLVQWTTPDGLDLEGVLTLPAPENRLDGPMPVLVIAHGGPSATSRPRRVGNQIYPTEYWLRKGAAIFEPNYRGSGSYTDELMAANVRSLGIGYTVDVESGIDHLIETGIADPEKLGAMGWSAGGTVTAGLAVRTTRYKAFSVGAGITDYGTYYALSDQPTSPLAYLEATPSDDPEIYKTTGAMGSIKNAVTPTLIQHGRDDNRVPFANGMEFFRGLKDVGVETELVIYEDTGHVISRPKERVAAMEHNARWFDKHLFGDRDDANLDLSAP
ncbi:S9 family peptidase [Parasphingorhabdus litoris]|uniref:S9 family peptidase n=1 Tax=Parasphingorhabdus litoris TaxID=394733 RepID=A0ABN1AI14_9SPHN|nr:prolyl oligopeptidase family serine peptidase [Parasphingorhabdus litoris]